MWLKCVALDCAGRTNESLEACVAGLAAHPDSMALNIVQARLLAQSDRYPDALRSIEQALARSSQQPELRPEALVVLADLVANGPKHDYPLALDYRLQAIQSAEPFSKDPRVAFQRVAHDATLDAHLGAASDIAHGNWKNKPETVTRWLERSRQLAGAGVSADHAARDRLKTCRKALEICKVLKGQIDPQPWVDSYTQEVRQLLASLRDPLSRTRLAWEAGMTMGDAMHALQSRGEREAALRAGGVAIGYLEEAVPKTAISPRESAALSSAYFRLGSIYAISDQDHKQASAWYDKAWEPLQRASSQQGPAQLNQGEMLVSMAVSYWAVGQQQRAEEAARRGVELIEGAVADGLAERRDLAIPYANLASIHRHLGREESARNYADLAARIKEGVKR
jgi:tetratricopeptide (TPR) repeat protein